MDETSSILMSKNTSSSDKFEKHSYIDHKCGTTSDLTSTPQVKHHNQTRYDISPPIRINQPTSKISTHDESRRRSGTAKKEKTTSTVAADLHTSDTCHTTTKTCEHVMLDATSSISNLNDGSTLQDSSRQTITDMSTSNDGRVPLTPLTASLTRISLSPDRPPFMQNVINQVTSWLRQKANERQRQNDDMTSVVPHLIENEGWECPLCGAKYKKRARSAAQKHLNTCHTKPN